MKQQLVVGISGKIGHGKDEIAKALITAHGAVRLGWADELREEILRRLRRTLKEIVLNGVGPDNSGKLPAHMKWMRTPERDGSEAWWDMRLRYELFERKQPIIRRLLQEYATEVRRADDPDYWCKAWLKRLTALDAPLVVVPDTRFLNEPEYIRMRRGLVVRVIRPDYVTPGEAGALAHNASENGLDDYDGWDHVFYNTGTVDELRAAALDWFRVATKFASPTTAGSVVKQHGMGGYSDGFGGRD